MRGMAAKVIITERQQQMLQAMAFSRGSPQGSPTAPKSSCSHSKVSRTK
jgi:hypothetical protein